METNIILGILKKVQNKEIDLIKAFKAINEVNDIRFDLEEIVESIQACCIRYVNSPEKSAEVLDSLIEVLKRKGYLPYVDMKNKKDYFCFGVVGRMGDFGTYLHGNERDCKNALTFAYINDIDFYNLINDVINEAGTITNKINEELN